MYIHTVNIFSYCIYAWVWLNPWGIPGIPKSPRHGLRRSLPVALELLEVRHLETYTIYGCITYVYIYIFMYILYTYVYLCIHTHTLYIYSI